MENFVVKYKDFLELIFSFITLLATVYTAFVAKKIGEKANEISKNSLRPYLDIRFVRLKETTYIKVVNNGLGTAIIRNIEIVYKGENFYSFTGLLDKCFAYRNFKEELNNLTISLIASTINLKKESIAPQNSIILLESNHNTFNCPDITAQKLSKIKKYTKDLQDLLSEISIVIEYVDIFEGKDSFYAKLK